MNQTKRVVAVTVLAAAGVTGSAGLASADGASQADRAPHSTAPVKQTGVANFNGDTTVVGLGKLLAPVNVPVGMAKTGAEQVANQKAAPQSDAPVLGMGGSPSLRAAQQSMPAPKRPQAPAPKAPESKSGQDGKPAPRGESFPRPGEPQVGALSLLAP